MNDNNSDRQDAEQWKRKYYDALGELENKEKYWRAAEDTLRRTLSRLSLAADGQDPALDRQLNELRKAVRDSVDTARLQNLLASMSDTLVALDARKAKTKTVTPQQALADLLERLPFPRGTAGKAKKLKKRLADAKPQDYPGDYLGEAAALLREAFPGETASAQGEGAGLLGRLFARNGKAGANEDVQPKPQNGEGLPTPGAALPDARDVLLAVVDGLDKQDKRLTRLRHEVHRAQPTALHGLARELAELLGTTQPAPPVGPVGGNGPAAQEILLQLLERLTLPAELNERLDAVKHQLDESPALDDWPGILSEIADLVAEMRSRVQAEKRDLESFLTQLTKRLQELDEHVRGAETTRAESVESGRAFNDTMQAQVNGIRTSVRDAVDLDQLKSSIQERLEAIQRHMASQWQTDQERNQHLETRLKALNERLQTMEQETEALRGKVQEERRQALVDPLTGLYNRLAYDERIAQEYARWKRFGAPLTLVVWDVDHFKRINDTYGHQAGDKVLKVIAKLLSDRVRETDFLARYGGEEFVMLMPGAVVDAALVVADKLRQAVEGCGFHYRGEAVPITASAGLAEFRADDTPEQVFERADVALYRAKEAGRNRCLPGE